MFDFLLSNWDSVLVVIITIVVIILLLKKGFKKQVMRFYSFLFLRLSKNSVEEPGN